MLNGRLYQFVLPAAVVLITVLAGYLARNLFFRRMLHWGKATRSRSDDIIINAVKGPFLVWWLILGISIALEVTTVPHHLSVLLGKILMVLGIGSVTFTCADIAVGLIRTNAGRLEKTALPITSLTGNIARVAIFSLGLLLILNSMGISIVPVLATLGVGGLAVALALQDTLASFFAGFHIIFSKQIKIGDYIKLDSGMEGYVTDINWRTTSIRQLSDNLVLVPNAKMTQAVITDYCLPGKELSFSVELTVDYASDLEKVERATRETAAGVMREVKGGVPGSVPGVAFQSLGDTGIGVSVSLRCGEFTDQAPVRHEFIKRLVKRYREESICIPLRATIK